AHRGVGVPGEAGLEEGGVEAGDQRRDARVQAMFAGDGGGVDVLGARRDGWGWGRRVVAVAGHSGEYRPVNSTYSVRSGLRAFTLLAALGAGLAGCHTGAEIDAGRAFPMAKDQSVRADIQVLRDVTHITFTNTTATDLPAG